MKRVKTSRIHNGQSHGDLRVCIGLRSPFSEGGWWITLGTPERRTCVGKGVPTVNRHTWGPEIWPDCLD